MLCLDLWKQSGHLSNFQENMYFSKIDNRDFGIKPMNCDGCMLIYKSKLHSYRELPLKLAELGLVHRHELSGVLHGLTRVRMFTQDDAHIFCSEDQIKSEIKKVIDLIKKIYRIFGFKDYHIEFSTRPKKSIGSDKIWKLAEKTISEVLKEEKIDYKLNPGDGAFYGPKIDFHIKDSLNRGWQCGTIQLDFSMPEKFDLTYEGQDGKKHRPIMLHRTVYGSLERFIAILIEHYAGNFPLWISPVQVVVLSLTDKNQKYAKEIKDKLEEEGIRVELNDKSETISKKVRDAQMEKICYVVTVGDKEQKNKTLAIRTRKGEVTFGVKLDKFIKDLKEEIEKKSQ